MLITAKSLLWQFVYCVYQLGLVPRVFFLYKQLIKLQKNTLTICTYYRVGVTPYVFFSFLFKIKQLNSKNNKIQIKQRVSEALLRCQHES